MMKSVKIQLKEVFSNPTAPYREDWVLAYIKTELQKLKTPYFQDKWGNIIAGVKKPSELSRSSRVALVAHTDHPGFHITKKISATRFLAQWHGGHPPKMKGSRLAIHHPALPNTMGVAKVLTEPDKKKFFKIVHSSKNSFPVDTHCFGAFDFPAYSFKGKKIETRVADDLAGVVIMLSVLRRLPTAHRKNFLCIFTTAEEMGFKGALGILRDKVLGPENKVISLEASRALMGAQIGHGPVIRLGDRRTLFDSDVISLLDEAAKGMKFQRRIMDGGTCEATAFNIFGIKAAGMAVPLGNYHNQKADGRPGPEQIHLDDVENAVKILLNFYKLMARKKPLPSQVLAKKVMTDLKKSEKYFKNKTPFAQRSPLRSK